MGKCLICAPRVFTREGGDHTGVDAYMRCTRCGERTICHVECHCPDEKVRRILRNEWFSGRTEPGLPSRSQSASDATAKPSKTGSVSRTKTNTGEG